MFRSIMTYVWGLLQTEIDFSGIGIPIVCNLFQIAVASAGIYVLFRLVFFCTGDNQ